MQRILIVEDEKLLALMLEDLLLDADYEVQHAFDLEEAKAIVSAVGIDAAILDVRIGGDLVFPFARALQERGVPYLFASSARRLDIPRELRAAPLVRKPYVIDEVLAALSALQGTARRPDRARPRVGHTTGEHPAL